ncbi:hypothetical protein [Clostridium magnum]|uniref:Uncharacterized protein n=1 Tax=Clostridium magnum DSM 2767 TaxID=1121326 RepID=A0A161W239_9CLOT|nr:hypothetical protein [Clostridium magnum]KZL89230.1 hypothetical protein CLMAG_54480 [Clostridium magnum DSM 2767]SHJ37122.1 hypothetical protein SAMN02745944_05848 [Clostridium magnum DSM 2767]
MKEVICINCKKKLSELDENKKLLIYENGVETRQPTYSHGLFEFVFCCPCCHKISKANVAVE